jgi:hypothetical protein
MEQQRELWKVQVRSEDSSKQVDNSITTCQTIRDDTLFFAAGGRLI